MLPHRDKGQWRFVYFPPSPVCWILTGTCTDLEERAHLIICFHDYLLSQVFTAIGQILIGRSHKLQIKKLKAGENIFRFFLPQPGIEPRTFHSWVTCFAIWAITPWLIWFHCMFKNIVLILTIILTFSVKQTEPNDQPQGFLNNDPRINSPIFKNQGPIWAKFL